MATMSRQAARTKVRKYLERKLVLLGHGDSLPPTRELMAESGVSKKRLEGVLSELESEGLIKRRARQGIFKNGVVGNENHLPGVVDIISQGAPTTLEEQRQYLENGYYKGGLIDAATIEASRRCQAIRFHFLSSRDPLSAYREVAGRADVQAVIFFWLHETRITELFDEHGVSWVSVHPGYGPFGHRCIMPEETMADLQMNHLFGLGHERIAYIWLAGSSASYHHAVAQRRERYYQLMAENHLRVQPNWVASATFDENSISKAIDTIYAQEPWPTAIIMSDPHLLTAYRCLKKRGLKIGDDVSVVGTDDLGISRMVLPPATTVRNPADEALHLAFESLASLFQGKTIPDKQYIPLEMVVRDSTGPCRQATGFAELVGSS